MELYDYSLVYIIFKKKSIFHFWSSQILDMTIFLQIQIPISDNSLQTL